MALDFGEDDEIESQGGGKLREKLEQSIAEIKRLNGELSTFKAKDFLVEKGLSLVKPEDLTGVDPDKFEEHAAKVQEDRRALQESLLREVLERQGYEGDELDVALAQMAGEKTKDSEDAEATRRMRAAGSAEGTPVPRVDPSKLIGVDAMRAAFEDSERKRARARS